MKNILVVAEGGRPKGNTAQPAGAFIKGAEEETAGMVAVIGVHLTGYLRMMDGYTDTSLLAREVPGNFIDGALSYWQSVALFLALIVVLMVLSSVFVKKIEFQSGTEVEGYNGFCRLAAGFAQFPVQCMECGACICEAAYMKQAAFRSE